MSTPWGESRLVPPLEPSERLGQSEPPLDPSERFKLRVEALVARHPWLRPVHRMLLWVAIPVVLVAFVEVPGGNESLGVLVGCCGC